MKDIDELVDTGIYTYDARLKSFSVYPFCWYTLCNTLNFQSVLHT